MKLVVAYPCPRDGAPRQRLTFEQPFDSWQEAGALAERHYDLEEGVDRYARIYRSLGVEP